MKYRLVLAMNITLAFMSAKACLAGDDLKEGIKPMLETARRESPAALRTVLQIALKTWPEAHLAILKYAEAIEPAVLTQQEKLFLQEAVLAAQAEEIKQKSRGIFYYLDPSLWDGQIEVGASLTSGDTDEKALALGLNFEREFGLWSHRLHAQFDYARRQGFTSRRSVNAEYALEYQISERTYLFNFLRAEANRFSGYDYRLIENMGLGFSLIKQEKQSLNWEAGVGVRYNRFEDRPESDYEFLARSALDYGWHISPSLKLNNRLSLLWGTETAALQNEFSLSARINSALAAKFSTEAQYETDPPMGSAAWDSITRASLVYDF